MPNPTDRRIFFPHSNNEQLASLLYLDFMSRPEVLDFLQFGFEGVHHEVLASGAIRTFPQDYPNPWPDNQIFTVIRNFDIALMVNGVHFWDTRPSDAEQTVALGYPGIPAELIIQARSLGLDNGRWFPPVPAPPQAAVEAHNAGLISQRIDILTRLVAGTSVEDFDAAFDREYDNYLQMGGQAIIDERAQIWEQLFGN
jgi:putative aldouronate transport system substrate-binding protein